jgi:hypothetical protein
MRLFQVIDQYGDDVGLFATERKDNDIITDIENCFTKAVEMVNLDPTIDIYDAAETYLEDKGIWREFIEENVIVETV